MTRAAGDTRVPESAEIEACDMPRCADDVSCKQGITQRCNLRLYIYTGAERTGADPIERETLGSSGGVAGHTGF